MGRTLPHGTRGRQDLVLQWPACDAAMSKGNEPGTSPVLETSLLPMDNKYTFSKQPKSGVESASLSWLQQQGNRGQVNNGHLELENVY